MSADRAALIDAANSAMAGYIGEEPVLPDGSLSYRPYVEPILDAVLPLIADVIEADEVLDDDLRAEVWDFFGWDQDDDGARDSVAALVARLTRHYAAAVRSLGSGQ